MKRSLFLGIILLLACQSPQPTVAPSPSVRQVSKAPDAGRARTNLGGAGGTLVAATFDLVALAAAGHFDGIASTTMKTLNDPAYNSGPRIFEGYLLSDVIDRLKGFRDFAPDAHDLRFVCNDGYMTTFSFKSLEGAVGLLAVGVRAGSTLDWPPYTHGKKTKTPAPFYLVWKDEKVSKDRPWPYQLTRIEVISKQAQGSRLQSKNGKHLAGRKVYETHCMACHSINLVGGKMGPELNVPQNICEYRSREYLEAFIRLPQSYRAGSLMPAMSFLSTEQMSSLLGYVCHMNYAKVCESPQSCTELITKAN